MHWQTARQRIDLSRPRVMGIVNLTPDSFSDGGRLADVPAALAHCERLLREGADILDLGAESTRPGSPPVPAGEELRRLLPVLREAAKLGAPVSVDTSKAEVMRQSLDAGADIVNDIWALRQAGAMDAVAAHPGCGVCLMHMHGEPRTMQLTPMEGDATAQVAAFLRERADAARARGVAAERIVLDPGVGFGKTPAQNFGLLVGWSRKSSLGHATGLAAGERLVPSVAAALLAVERGARVVRVHDVKDTVAALQVWRAASQDTGKDIA